MWSKVHVKTSHGDPARSNPWNHHQNAIKDQRPEQSHRGDKKGRPKKGQKTNSPQEPRKRRLVVHVNTGYRDPARSNPRNHHKNAIKDQRPEQSHRVDKKGRPKKCQKTNNPQEPRKKRLVVHVKTDHGDQARSNPWNHHNNAIKINDQNNHIGETKREDQKKVERQTAPRNQEKED